MNSDINLIRKQTKTTARRLKVLRAIVVATASLVALSSIALFMLTRQNSVEAIKAEQNAVLQNITQLQDKAAKINFLNDRIRNIESILSARKNYVGTIGLVLEGMPSNVSASSITIDENDIIITVTGSSLAGINDFLNSTIEFADEKHLLKDLTIESLSAQNNIYSLTLKAKLL